MKLPWYVSAVGAAVIWGVHYPLLDHALKRLSLFTVLFLTVLPMLLAAPFYYPQLAADAGMLTRMSWGERLPVLLIPLTSLAGAVLLFLAISARMPRSRALSRSVTPCSWCFSPGCCFARCI